MYLYFIVVTMSMLDSIREIHFFKECLMLVNFCLKMYYHSFGINSYSCLFYFSILSYFLTFFSYSLKYCFNLITFILEQNELFRVSTLYI